MKPAKRKSPMTQNLVCNKKTPPPPPPPPSSPPQVSRPQQFSALAAKYTLQDSTESDDDCFAGKEGDESDTDTSDNDSDGGGSDDEVCT